MNSAQIGIWRSLYGALRILALAGIVVYLAGLIADGRTALGPQLAELRFAALASAFLIAILAYQFLFGGWLMMLRRTGLYRPGNLPAYARIWWVSYMYRYVPGKVMLVTERARLGAAAGIPPAAGAAMPVIETILAILAGSTVSLLAVTFYSTGSGWRLPLVLGLMAITLLLLPVGLRWLSRRSFVRRKFPDLEAITLSTSDLVILAVPFVAHYLMLGTAVFLFARGMYPLSWSELPGICGVYALSHVISLLVVLAPGGLGVREGALAVQLEQAVPGAVAGAVTVGARLGFTIVELVCLAGILVVCPRRVLDKKSGTDDENAGNPSLL